VECPVNCKKSDFLDQAVPGPVFLLIRRVHADGYVAQQVGMEIGELPLAHGESENICGGINPAIEPVKVSHSRIVDQEYAYFGVCPTLSLERRFKCRPY
jgi:hypothetical protein